MTTKEFTSFVINKSKAAQKELYFCENTENILVQFVDYLRGKLLQRTIFSLKVHFHQIILLFFKPLRISGTHTRAVFLLGEIFDIIYLQQFFLQ